MQKIFVIILRSFFIHNFIFHFVFPSKIQKFRHVLYGLKSNKFSSRSVESDYDENTDDEDSDSDDDWQNSVATTDIDTDGSDEEYDAEVHLIYIAYDWECIQIT